MHIDFVEISVCLLFALFVISVNPSFALETPSLTFDQDLIAIDHSSVITLVNDAASGDLSKIVTVEIPNSPDAQVTLYEVLNNPGTFSSNFVNFTSSLTADHGISPKIPVVVNDTIRVHFEDLEDYATIVSKDNPPPIIGVNAEEKKTLRITRCSSYGGDNDHDGICDYWESGTDGLRITYPAGGEYHLPCGGPNTPDPVCPSVGVKDIYVEIDWMAGHKPNREALQMVKEAFDVIPNNTSGPLLPYELHYFLDEEPAVDHFEVLEWPGRPGMEGFDQIKAANFGTNWDRTNYPNWDNTDDWKRKAQVFRYALWAHSLADCAECSGKAEEGGNDLIITLGDWDGGVGSKDQHAGTFMHELGHAIFLDHGGPKDDDINCKPNLLSIMSYTRQFRELVPDRMLDYSRDVVDFTIPISDTLTTLENPTEATVVNNRAGIEGYDADPLVDPETHITAIGIGQGSMALITIPNTQIPWSTGDWQDIRWIQDSQGRVVCERNQSGMALGLTGYNQWNEITLDRKNSHWRE